MATQRKKYYEKMLETLVDYTNVPLFNEKFRQEIRAVMAETE